LSISEAPRPESRATLLLFAWDFERPIACEHFVQDSNFCENRENRSIFSSSLKTGPLKLKILKFFIKIRGIKKNCCEKTSIK
jgi:hypothetical protein